MKRRPSILFVLPWELSAAGGVNQVVLNLAREAARRHRLQPIIFCADWSQEHFTEEEHDGVTVVSGRLRQPLARQNPMRNFAGFAFTMRRQIVEWRKFIADHNVRIINMHYVGLNYFVFAILRAFAGAKIRLLYSLHGADLAEMRQGGPANAAMMRWMLRQGHRVICCSDDLARRARNTLKIDERRIITIHNGIDIDELEASKHVDYVPKTGDFDNYLLSVGTFEHKKGQDVLMHAFTKLLREGLKSALVLIGRSTPHIKTLRNTARQLGLQHHVFFVPDLDHTKTLAAIRNARLLVQPSREEPFGITLLEAGYLETPIVATRTGGIPEVLGSYYPYLAEPDNPDALAQTIDDALFNPTETGRQINLMKRRVATTFTWGSAFGSYEAFWTRKRS